MTGTRIAIVFSVAAIDALGVLVASDPRDDHEGDRLGAGRGGRRSDAEAVTC